MKPETRDTKIKRLIFVVGIGMMCAYYGLTCLTFILAYMTRSNEIIIHVNIWNELNVEFLITVGTIPCTAYAIKESIRLKKHDLKNEGSRDAM